MGKRREAVLIQHSGNDSGAESFVEVWRGPMVESCHRVHVAVADGEGRLRGWSGDAARVVYARSAVKPIQALPLVADGVAFRIGLTDEELALACASHSGEPRHVELARSMLQKSGLGEDALACGPHAPFHAESARELRRQGRQPGRLHNNCSGKHAGMLALAVAHGWPAAGYHRPEHPVQQRVLEEVATWCDVPAREAVLATDGCGVVTFGVPLRQLARAFAALATAARRGEEAPRQVVAAMVRHPAVVGGTDRLCTRVVEVTGGRVFLKVGAEGVYAAAGVDGDLGIALKVEDGAGRAAEAGILAVLERVGLVTGDEVRELERFGEPPVRNTRGEVVGVVRPRLNLGGAA
jgi:L-asparaginase II